MQIIDLYVYEEEGGFVTVTPNKRNEADMPGRARLIAEEGFMLTNGIKETPARDVKLDEVDKWYEIDSTDEATETNYISALNEKDKIIDILSGEGE